MLCGKNSDQDNLAGTVNRLLALREAANLVYLAKAAQKQGEMEAMAGVIAASFGVPAAMPVVKMALAVCWAFAESILDLRELLDGGKVALFKTAESWQLSLEQLPKLLETGDQSRKNAPGGMEYSDYLRLLLMQKSGKAVTFGLFSLQIPILTIVRFLMKKVFAIDFLCIHCIYFFTKSFYKTLASDPFRIYYGRKTI